MSQSRTWQATPWTAVDAAKAALLIAVGAVLWIIGWYPMSGRVTMNAQIAPMNLAVFGVILTGVGQASWFLAGRRSVSLRRRQLIGAQARPRPVIVRAVGEEFVGGDRLYHRVDCALANQRSWAPTSRAAHEAEGRLPCGVCAP